MSTLILTLLSIAISLAVSSFGFATARRYVRDRLKYVEGIQTMKAPILAGIVATIVFSPLALLPFVGIGTAIVFGLSVGLGVRAGARDILIGGGY